ncbi:glutathione S-transferase family protein [Roseovarius sp. SCSIO 43702]|uniref:glutathione S-transferase family protein n=1 Tax=Roseovarius sp. SCSIO 43702 TaxID=2823043 RepID=UPI001C7392AC|nr:glutathione S-transferase family protein [Roseovarius sp. SCSIO 43702]QYX55634.1 glutathione S-transferase family protein [Roseovarius sp. SCSIO 43702]
MTLTLTGYRFSVYTRALRIALAVKGATYDCVERDPFDPADAEALGKVHPFGRVPALEDDGFRIYETAACLELVAGMSGPSLLPSGLRAMVRMRQVISITDSYVYWPLIRGAVSETIFGPLEGATPDAARLAEGFAAAPRALDALEAIAEEGLCLSGDALTLADCHLLPMLDYFGHVPQGADMIAARPALAHWLAASQARPEVAATRPDLGALASREKA